MNRFTKNLFSSLITVPSLPFILFISCLFLLILNSCNSTEPPLPPPVTEPTDTVTVSVTDKTHRSITLNVKTTLNNKDWKIELFREKQTEEDTLLADFSVETEDTTIIDDNGGKGLELETEYGYYTILITGAGEVKDTSEKVIGRTLGATSHNYVWEEYTIGESGALYDVWGTDENNVYAVGFTITINGLPYGVIKWNGTEWLPEKLGGGARAIYGFSEDDIWVVGNGVWYYDGREWKEIVDDNVLNGNKEYTCLWGTSSENLYFGNHWGKIVHWDGRRGRLEDVDAGMAILGMHGIDANNIYAVGNDFFLPGIALKYDGLNWNIVQGIDYNHVSLESVYVRSKNEIYYCGSGIIEYFGTNINRLTELTTKSLYEIKGNESSSDMFAVGYQEVIHFNGTDWESFSNEVSHISESQLNSVFLFENSAFIVGQHNNKGIILIGKR